MKPIPLSLHGQSPAVTDVYTNLHGLQALKNEANEDEALKKVSQQFESMFISMMMKNMRAANAVFEEGNPFHSEESKFYRDMLDNQQALTMAHGRGLGIAEALYRQLAKTYGSGEDTLNESMPLLRSADPRVQTQTQTQIKTQPKESSPTKEAHDQRIAIADSPEDFIAKMTPHAEKAANALGVDKSILLAQSALETGWGKYVLANGRGDSSHNVFNIKRGVAWQNESVNHTTLEFSGGVFSKEQAEFRVYDHVAASFDDYVDFISKNARYEKAVLSQSDNTYIRELQAAGYATDPDYSDKVLDIQKRINSFLESQKTAESARYAHNTNPVKGARL